MNPETGSVEFESVMQRFMIKDEVKIRKAVVRQPVHFFVFDILRYKGKDMRAEPLTVRRIHFHRCDLALMAIRWMAV